MARTIKIALIGSSGTGKTSLRGQFTSGQFSSSYRATIGADFIAKTIHLPNEEFLSALNQNTAHAPSTSTSNTGTSQHTSPDSGEAVTLQIWDTAGQERFSALASAFFRGADAAIIVYDVRRPKSLAEVSTWWRAFADKCPVLPEEEATWPVVVVGNKIDLLNQVEGTEDAIWRKEEAREFVERLIDVTEEDVDPAEVNISVEGPSGAPEEVEASKAVSITINGHGIDELSNGSGGSANQHRDRIYPATSTTYNSSRTGNTIFHTPSSSFHSNESSEHFHSAASSFYSQSPVSPAPSLFQSGSGARSRSRRRLTIDTLSSSSETITPSLYARGLPPPGSNAPASPGPPTPRTPSIRHPWPPPDLDPPERGAKLLFTSAKTGEGVSEVFNYIARRTVRRLEWFEAHHDIPFGEESVIAHLGRGNVNNLSQFGTLAGRCC